jgi:hypothetical protein
MTSRQARKLRREQERKAKKAAYKAALRPVAATPNGPVPFDGEFPQELLAEARSMRERIERRIAPRMETKSPSQDSGFVSQTAAPAHEDRAVDEPVPLSEAKTRREINRANAAHSTGPRSREGKSASSRNSLKHGLASGQLIIPGEDSAQFETLLNDLLADHQPANATEQLLLHEMAQSFWLTQRAIRLQNECFTHDGVDEKRLALFLRYQTTHDRAFHKALNTLIRLQKDRRKSERKQSAGFVSQQRPDPGRRLHEPAHLSEAKTETKAFVSHTEPANPAASGSESENPPRPQLAEAA